MITETGFRVVLASSVAAGIIGIIIMMLSEASWAAIGVSAIGVSS